MTANSNPIVAEAMRLLRDWPQLEPLAILDRAMDGHHGEHPEFESRNPLTGQRPHPAYADDTDIGTPFAELLRRAFDPSLDPIEVLLVGNTDCADDNELRNRINALADRWERVIEKFANRYQLWA